MPASKIKVLYAKKCEPPNKDHINAACQGVSHQVNDWVGPLHQHAATHTNNVLEILKYLMN